MLLAIALLSTQPVSCAIDMDRMIDCIAAVETGNKWGSPGGAMQWTRKTWHEDFPNIPYAFAAIPVLSRYAAKVKLARIAKRLEDAAIQVDPISLAMVWHHGFAGMLRLIDDYQPADSYAMRVSNLYLAHP